MADHALRHPPGQEVKLGNRPKTISITPHFKGRLNSIIGALACSTPTANQIFRNVSAGDRTAFNNIC